MLKVLLLCISAAFSPLAAAADNTQPDPIVVIKTSDGDITLRLFRDKAPITVDNFLAYVDSEFYSGTIFHRVVRDFAIQGGGFLPDLTELETRPPIVNESRNRLHNTRGTIAMARTRAPDSATSQFFINHRNNLNLDWMGGRVGYTVFGEVISGMNVVDYIASTPTIKKDGMKNVPEVPIVINEIMRAPLL